MGELVESIAEVGLLQPIVVVRCMTAVRTRHGRAPLAGRPTGRPDRHSRDRPETESHDLLRDALPENLHRRS